MAKINSITLNPEVEYVKIHGLQRSGTNYLAYLINENFENTKALINAGGWKHGHYCAPWTLGQEVHVLTIVKNPYSWLWSAYNYWKTDGLAFNQFVRDKIIVEKQAGTPFLYRSENPVQHWNNMNFHWTSIKINEKKSLVVPYELLVVMPEQVIEGIGLELGLKKKHSNNFICPSNTMAPSEEEPKVSDEGWKKREYYANNAFMSEYTADILQFVNSQLDWELMGVLGYTFDE
jgi:hypothetical protein